MGQKRFLGIYSTAPCFAGNSWTSAGLKMRPAWRQVHCRGQPAWQPHRHWPVGPGGVGRPARPHRLCRLEMAGGDNLLPVPDPDCEGARHTVENGVRAVVGPLQGWDNPPVVNQDKRACRRSADSSSGSCWLKLCLLGREKCRSTYDFRKFVKYLIYRKFLNQKKLIWQNKGNTINCLSWRKTCVLSELGP